MKRLLLLLLSILVFVVSCGSGAKTETKGSSVSFNVEAEPSSLDPQLLTDTVGFQIAPLLYEGLVRLNEKNEVVPAGAESWTVSEDGKTITLKVRQGMKWSNGDPLTANDYVRGMK